MAEPRRIEKAAPGQGTFQLQAGDFLVLTGLKAVTWRLKNMGPAEVWARWDGEDAKVDDEGSLVLEAGEIIPTALSDRMTLVAGSKPAGGARVSLTTSAAVIW